MLDTLLENPLLHFFCPLHSCTGSVKSALTLCDALKSRVDIQVWSLPVDMVIDPIIREQFGALDLSVEIAWPIPELPKGSHLFFHMGEYPIIFGNHVGEWQRLFKASGSVQISFNFNIGSLYQYSWMAEHLDKIYFQNQEMVVFWKHKTAGSPLSETRCVVLPPPVDLDPFLHIREPVGKSLVVGRLTGDANLPFGAIEFYNNLSERLPSAEFWFMPTPDVIIENFAHHPQFHLFNEDELSVIDFISAMDVYCVPTNPNAQTLQGTRSLVEVMAAGRPSVHVNRMGPRDRIVHGESGFVTDDLSEMAEYVVALAGDDVFRNRIGKAARLRARGWKVSDWRDVIVSSVTI